MQNHYPIKPIKAYVFKNFLTDDHNDKSNFFIECEIIGLCLYEGEAIAFDIVLNDGSCQNNIQIIVDEVLPNYAEVAALLIGSAVSITGRLVKGGGKVPQVEMQAKSVEIIGKTDESYPLQKKATSLESISQRYCRSPLSS